MASRLGKVERGRLIDADRDGELRSLGHADAIILRRLAGKGYLLEVDTGRFEVTEDGRRRARLAQQANDHKTTVGQRTRVARHRHKRQRGGMVRTELWVPIDRLNELREIAQDMRDEHEAARAAAEDD